MGSGFIRWRPGWTGATHRRAAGRSPAARQRCGQHAADQIDVVDLALAQLPRQAREDQPILVRADSAGATHGLVDHLRALGVRFSVGFDLDSRVRTAILALPAEAWVAALDADGTDRDGARSPSCPPWTCRRRAGYRALGRSAGGSGPTQAPS